MGAPRTVAALKEDAKVLFEQDVGVEHDDGFLTFHAPFIFRGTSSG